MTINTAIGIVAFTEVHLEQELNYKMVIGCADKAAFASKKKGKHQYSVYRHPVKNKRKTAVRA